jgi:hypothetical protein
MSNFELKNGVPEGLRFDQLYVARGAPLRDSEKMRHRLAALLRNNMPPDFDKFAEGEIGLRTPYSAHKLWPTLLQEWQLQDVLSLLTIAVGYIRATRGHNAWAATVARIFDEEKVGYAIDRRGGVHPHIDGEFAVQRAATIAALSGPRHANVLNEFEAGSDAVGKDNKIAIIRTFMAAEGLFRLIIDTSPRLVAGEVDKILPHMKARFREDAIAERVSTKILASFKDWIDACHFYRHEQAQEAISPTFHRSHRILD